MVFSPKVNVMVWLEFELVYYDVTIQHASHLATENLLVTL